MKIMSIEEAVEYSRDKKITIHTPTQEAYDRLEKYAREHGLTWLTCNRFPECGSDICVNLSTTHTQCSDIDWYREQGYEIIELKSPDEEPVKSNKIKRGDIVEVLNNTLKSQFSGTDESIGLQGIVTMTNDDEGIGIRVKFPVRLHDGFEEFDEFEFDEDDLKLIRRA